MNAIENIRWYVAVCADFGEIDSKSVKAYNELIDRIENEYMELPRDKNGKVIHVGDTFKFDDLLYEVAGIAKDEYIIVYDPNGCGTGMRSDAVELVKPEQPDSMERIKADAVKNLKTYWDCDGYECADCPVKINGDNPADRYDAFCCEDALRLDLIARTKKLLGGER